MKVPRPANKRPVLCLPYDPRLPPISSILARRHRALLANDPDAREYLASPPMVTYTRTKNLRDLVFRAQVPTLHRPLRHQPGFRRCGQRSNCVLCLHSSNATAYTCPYTGVTISITQRITCQSSGVYLLRCRKSTGVCARLAPTYIGITGEGDGSSFTHRLGQHIGSAMQPGQADTNKTISRHFRLPGHDPHRDMVMLPLEVVGGGTFMRRARERFYISQLQTEKRRGVEDVEHGLNLDRGQ